jgi:hypothetical protein
MIFTIIYGIIFAIISGLLIGVIGLILSLLIPVKNIILFRHFQSSSMSGNPSIAQAFWKKQSGNTCAINVQRIVLEIFGKHKEERDLAERQKAFGKYADNEGSKSTSFLLDGYGLETKKINLAEFGQERYLFQLWKLIRKGRLLIAPVNSFLLNNPDSSFSQNEDKQIDHAVLITAIETHGKDKLDVFYCDTGVNNGSIRKINGADFYYAAGKELIATPKNFNVNSPNNSFGLNVINAISALLAIYLGYYFFKIDSWLFEKLFSGWS